MPQVESIEPGPDTIRLLITTDNHVGYNESDPVRSDDAWITFEEIMSLARDEEVDFVLQSGDLFHINKPTKKSLYHVMRILRRCCMGDRPVELELLSDPGQVFDDGFNVVNYEDPNLNVAMPVFSISGNHDDASGSGLLSPLDILGVSGLVNHFGRVVQTDQITITPVLLQKGSTKLAMYGLAAVRDERLFKTFKDKKVKFQIPSVAEDEWFNLMAVHQNHAIRPNTAYLPEHFLPSFLDLVVWGHEHECIPHAVTNVRTGFDVLQPGSSVATSLSISEAVEKKVFILNIKNNDYSLEPFRLKTVRPFHMREILLSSEKSLRPGERGKNEVTQYLVEKVEELITLANSEYSELNPDSDIPLPLIRLRVDYTGGYEVENPRRFSNRFVGRVANANSVVQFHRKVETNKSSKMKATFTNEGGSNDEGNINIETFINNYLKETELGILPESGFNNAIKRFIQNDDKTAIKDFFQSELSEELKNFLKLDNVEVKDDDNFDKFVKQYKKERETQRSRSGTPSKASNDIDTTTKAASKSQQRSRSGAALESDEDMSYAQASTPLLTEKAPRKRGGQRGKAKIVETAPAVRPSRTKRARRQESIVISSDDGEDDANEVIAFSDEEPDDDGEDSFQEINSDSEPEFVEIEEPEPVKKMPTRRGRGTRKAAPPAPPAARKTTQKKAAVTKKSAPRKTKAPAKGSAEGISNLLMRK